MYKTSFAVFGYCHFMIFNDICSVSILINVRSEVDNDKWRLFWAILNSASSYHIVGCYTIYVVANSLF